MFIPDSRLTAAYREAIVALGFDRLHASLVQVDVVDGVVRTDLPRYRISTGTDTVRGGQTIRRSLLLWYVLDEAAVLAEIADHAGIARTMNETISHLPSTARTAIPDNRVTTLAPRTMGRPRRAA